MGRVVSVCEDRGPPSPAQHEAPLAVRLRNLAIQGEFELVLKSLAKVKTFLYKGISYVFKELARKQLLKNIRPATDNTKTFNKSQL